MVLSKRSGKRSLERVKPQFEIPAFVLWLQYRFQRIMRFIGLQFPASGSVDGPSYKGCDARILKLAEDQRIIKIAPGLHGRRRPCPFQPNFRGGFPGSKPTSSAIPCPISRPNISPSHMAGASRGERIGHRHPAGTRVDRAWDFQPVYE